MTDRNTQTRIPSFRRQRHKNRPDRAYTVLNGRRMYLGHWDDPRSKSEYDRLIAEWLVNDRQHIRVDPSDTITITELAVAFMQDALSSERYRTPANFKPALRVLRKLYGHTPVGEFTLSRFEVTQQALVRQRHARTGKPWSRRYINQNMDRLLRVFRWGKKHKYVPPHVWADIEDIDHLQRGRTSAPESEPIKPVPEEHVDAIRSHVSRQVWAMIELQRLTGMRPGEVVVMRAIDIDRSRSVWIYHPKDHKNAHRGKKRFIPLGPKAKEIIEPFIIGRDVDACLFSPHEAEVERKKQLRRRRKSKVQPSQQDRSKLKPRRKPNGQYTTVSYAQAIRRAIRTVFPHPTLNQIPRKELTPDQRKELSRWKPPQHWHPNQLRHSFATDIRQRHGVEAASVLLGHSKIETTQIYAQTNLNQAIELAERNG